MGIKNHPQRELVEQFYRNDIEFFMKNPSKKSEVLKLMKEIKDNENFTDRDYQKVIEQWQI